MLDIIKILFIFAFDVKLVYLETLVFFNIQRLSFAPIFRLDISEISITKAFTFYYENIKYWFRTGIYTKKENSTFSFEKFGDVELRLFANVLRHLTRDDRQLHEVNKSKHPYWRGTATELTLSQIVLLMFGFHPQNTTMQEKTSIV